MHFRLLRHGVHEGRVHQQQPVDLAFLVGVEHDLDRADQILDVREVAEALDAARGSGFGRRRKNAVALLPIRHIEMLRALGLPVAHRHQRALEDVDVERAAQSAIGRDHDDADVLHFGAFLQERVAVVRDWPASGCR